MRKLVVTMWITLDGRIAGPNNDMGYVGELYDDAMGKYEYDLVSHADTLVLGRVTYESFAGSWPKVPDNPAVSDGEKAYARILNGMKKIVFSKTLQKADWEHSTLVREIVAADVKKWKQQSGKDMVIYGSASIVQQMTNLGLIDEYQLLLHPFVLGGGKTLFENIMEKVKLRLAGVKTHPSGVVLLTYQPANP